MAVESAKRKVLRFDEDFRRRNWINGRTLRYQFVSPLKGGEARFSTYAVSRAGGHVEIMEVVRVSSRDWKVWTRNLDYRGMAGWVVSFGEPWKWRRQSGEYFPKVYDPVVNPEALARTRFARSGYTPHSTVELTRYLRVFEKNSAVEYLGKAGLFSLVSDRAVARLARDMDFRRFVQANRGYIAEQQSTYTEVAFAHRHGMSVQEADGRFMAYHHIRSYGINVGGVEESHAVWSWADRHGINLRDYSRYIGYARTAGWDTSDRRVLMPPPKGFAGLLEYAEQEAHRTEEARRRLEEREANEAIMSVASRFGGCASSAGTLSVVLPTSVSDLVREGESMANCVGRMGYDRRIADGRSILFFIRVPGLDRSVADVEVDRERWVIRQCYGPKNSTAPAEAWKLAEKTMKRMRKQSRRTA